MAFLLSQERGISYGTTKIQKKITYATLSSLINGHARLFIFQKNSTLPALIRACPFIKSQKKFYPARLLGTLVFRSPPCPFIYCMRKIFQKRTYKLGTYVVNRFSGVLNLCKQHFTKL